MPNLSEVLAALEPFRQAADELDDTALPKELHAPDEMYLDEALWTHQQPIVGDLRRARDFHARLSAEPTTRTGQGGE